MAGWVLGYVVDPDLPASLVRGLAEAVGLDAPVIDLLPCLLEAEERGENVYYGTNTHWSVSGNDVVGRVLADVLEPAWFGLTETETPTCRTQPLEPDPSVGAYLNGLLGAPGNSGP